MNGLEKDDGGVLVLPRGSYDEALHGSRTEAGLWRAVHGFLVGRVSHLFIELDVVGIRGVGWPRLSKPGYSWLTAGRAVALAGGGS